MIHKQAAQQEVITGATCDCCGQSIQVHFGQLADHVAISGYQDGKLLEAIVCIKCKEEKLSFIKIAKKDNTIGYCYEK